MAGVEEDDYMGDLSLFVSSEASSSSKKVVGTKEPLSAPKLKRPRTLSWQEHRKLEKERKQREEDKYTKASLEAAIPETNLGFQMLRQMGYEPGTALGKKGCGRAEPVGLEIRRSRAGIGRETPEDVAVRMEREVLERLRRREEEMVAEFGSRQRMMWRDKKVVGDYHKADAALAQLEKRVIVETKELENESEKPEAEEKEEVITDEHLQEVLMKLRDEHCYCLYCGCQYESVEALESGCPGVYEEDH